MPPPKMVHIWKAIQGPPLGRHSSTHATPSPQAMKKNNLLPVCLLQTQNSQRASSYYDCFRLDFSLSMGFPGSSVVRNLPAMQEVQGLIPG